MLGPVLGGTPSPSPATPTGVAFVQRGRLVARGARDVRNNLIARVVSCRAVGVRRIVLYGGAGNDRLTVIGRIRVTFRGGPGRDVTRRLRR